VPVTLHDRFGIAFLSGVLAFLGGIAVWGLMFILTWFVLPFELVLWFTAVMAVLGFLMAESLLVTIFEKVWRLIYCLVMGEESPRSQGGA
jgi:hypothetical protein